MSGLLRKTLSSVSRPGSLLAGALLAASLGNTVFHLVATRLLGPRGYGELGSLLSVLAVLNIPAGAVQTSLAGQVTRLTESGSGTAPQRLAWRAARTGAVVCLTAAVLSPLLAHFLQLRDGGAAFALSLYLFPAVTLVVPWGYLCGTGALRAVAAAVLAGAVSKVALGTILMSAGFATTGAMAAAAVSDCVTLSGLLFAMQRRSGGVSGARAEGENLRFGAGNALRSTSAMAGLWILTTVDVLAAQHFLAGPAAGRYAAASFAAKMVFFLSQIVAVARIRQFAGSDRTAARTSVAGTLFITLALGVSASVGMVACGPFLFPLVFGTDFSIAPLAALYIGTAVTLTALVGVLIQFQIAVGHQRAAAGWAGSAVFVLAVLVLQPHNEAGIGLALLAAAAVAMVLGFLPFRRSFQRPDGGTTVPPYDPTEEDERTDARLSVQLEGLSTPRGGGS